MTALGANARFCRVECVRHKLRARSPRLDWHHRCQMSKSPSRRFPVTVTQLPVTLCEICRRTVACRPGRLSEVLTEHYRRAHPEVLGVFRSSLGQAAALPRGYRHRRRLPPGDLARAGRESASGHGVAAPREGPAHRTALISSPLWGVSHVALRAFELRGGRVILSGVYDAPGSDVTHVTCVYLLVAALLTSGPRT
jgi:hypothetical protein